MKTHEKWLMFAMLAQLSCMLILLLHKPIDLKECQENAIWICALQFVAGFAYGKSHEGKKGGKR